MSPAITCLILLVIVAILFVTEIIPLAVTSIMAAMACGLLGLIPMNEVFLGLADDTVVLFGGMFIVGASMFHTGLAQRIGGAVVRACGTSENKLMFGVMTIAAALSSVLSNTGTCACLIPVVKGICAKAHISCSRQLLPLAYACGLGGTITLIGTPPNIIANVALKTAGMEELQFGFFEYAWLGIPITVAGILYMMLIGKYLLPNEKRDIPEEDKNENEPATCGTIRRWICGFILTAVVVSMALGLPLHMVAIAGAVACVLTRCITEKQAYASIDWMTIFLFAGMIPLATAMNTSGAGKLIADNVISWMGGSPSVYLVTVVLFLIAVTLTQFMSNTASKALLCPVGIAIAADLGANPQAVLMAILIASSCAFASPVGTPPNTLVLGPGHYRFMDYLKSGTGLVLVCLLVSCIVIPVVWPYY